MHRHWIAAGLTALVVMPGQALAQSYCRVSPAGAFVPGQAQTATWKVVVSTVARPTRIDGRPMDFCSLNNNTADRWPMARPVEVVEKPRRGTLQLSRFGLEYRSRTVGRDGFVIRYHQSDPRTNKPVTTPVTVNVDVVAAPF